MSLLGQIVAGEAATPIGQQAVINVLQNRAAINFGGYGTTLEAQATAPRQFSAYPNALGQPSATTESYLSAAQNGTLGNVVPNALNYANPTVGNTGRVGWVASNVAGGQGVNVGGEGNIFWGPNGTSPGYNPSAAGITGGAAGVGGAVTDGSTSESLSTNVTGTLSGVPSGGALTNNGTLSPDITGYTVAGVNAPFTSDLTGTGTLSPEITGYTVAGVNAPFTSDLTGAAATASPGSAPGTGTPINVTDLANLPGAIASAASSSNQQAQADTQASTSTDLGIVGSLEATASELFVRSGVVILGVIFVGAALFLLARQHEPRLAAA